jgi:hypothetical protein
MGGSHNCRLLQNLASLQKLLVLSRRQLCEYVLSLRKYIKDLSFDKQCRTNVMGIKTPTKPKEKSQCKYE